MTRFCLRYYLPAKFHPLLSNDLKTLKRESDDYKEVDPAAKATDRVGPEAACLLHLKNAKHGIDKWMSSLY